VGGVSGEPEGREVPIVWSGVEDLPVLYVNQFVSQAGPGEIFLTIGQLQPPALLGNEEERREQIEQISYVQVKPIARLAMTPSKLKELIQVLQITDAGADQQNERFGDPRGHD
jgi:hypothetical protein